MRLPYPTDDAPDLIHAAVPLLERMYRPGFHYQTCGVMLMDLSPAAYHRRDLFDTRDQARQARLMDALDRLNADHGARRQRGEWLGGRQLGLQDSGWLADEHPQPVHRCSDIQPVRPSLPGGVSLHHYRGRWADIVYRRTVSGSGLLQRRTV